MNIIEYKNKLYPNYETIGPSSRFIEPFAKEWCTGKGYDIGCNRKEWSINGSIPIDITLKNEYNAYNLPKEEVDYIFSSHCLEHLPNWVGALDYWYSNLKENGILFLYLPHYDQEYWRPWNNRKHISVLTPELIKDYLTHKNFKYIQISGIDLNHSFSCVGIK